MFSLVEVLSKCLVRTARKVLGVKIGCYQLGAVDILVRIYPMRRQPVYVREARFRSRCR